MHFKVAVPIEASDAEEAAQIVEARMRLGDPIPRSEVQPDHEAAARHTPEATSEECDRLLQSLDRLNVMEGPPTAEELAEALLYKGLYPDNQACREDVVEDCEAVLLGLDRSMEARGRGWLDAGEAHTILTELRRRDAARTTHTVHVGYWLCHSGKVEVRARDGEEAARRALNLAENGVVDYQMSEDASPSYIILVDGDAPPRGYGETERLAAWVETLVGREAR